MIYCTNKIYAKVWKVIPADNGKYIDLQVSTYEKVSDDEFKYSNWFPRVIGHALNSLKNVKEGDRIAITKSKFSNERYDDADGNKKSFFKFIILEAKINDESQEKSVANDVDTKQDADTSADCPW